LQRGDLGKNETEIECAQDLDGVAHHEHVRHVLAALIGAFQACIPFLEELLPFQVRVELAGGGCGFFDDCGSHGSVSGQAIANSSDSAKVSSCIDICSNDVIFSSNSSTRCWTPTLSRCLDQVTCSSSPGSQNFAAVTTAASARLPLIMSIR